MPTNGVCTSACPGSRPRRRVRVFGDDVRIMRSYPGQWQVRAAALLVGSVGRIQGLEGRWGRHASIRSCCLAMPGVCSTVKCCPAHLTPTLPPPSFPRPIHPPPQVHFVPASPQEDTVLLSCEDRKPTFQRLMELLKGLQGSR